MSISLCLATAPVVARAESAGEDPLELLQEVRNLFRQGSYEEVVRITGQVLENEPSMLIQAEALQYLGASLELLGQSEDAEDQFEVLLTLQPQFRIDHSLFPTEVVTLFETVRIRVQDRLDQIQEQRRRSQEAGRRERERRLLEQQQQLIALARPRYIVHEVERRYVAVALLPFGAGQFQNGQTRRGYVYMGVQLGLTAASMTLWLLGTLVPSDPEDPEQARRLYVGYWASSIATYASLAITVVVGIIDALVNLRRRRGAETWTEVGESEVPAEHRVEVTPILEVLDLPTAGQETRESPNDN